MCIRDRDSRGGGKGDLFLPRLHKVQKICQIVSRHVQPPDDIATGQKNIVIPVCLPDAPASVHPAYRGIAVEEFGKHTALFAEAASIAQKAVYASGVFYRPSEQLPVLHGPAAVVDDFHAGGDLL